jgi:hypothetical protein
MLRRVTPAGRPDDTTTSGGRPAPVFARRCPAEPGSLPALRAGVDTWLAGLGGPDDESERDRPRVPGGERR